jgi:hypothetical protein
MVVQVIRVENGWIVQKQGYSQMANEAEVIVVESTKHDIEDAFIKIGKATLKLLGSEP